MNFRSESWSRNKSLFALSLFGRAVGWEWAFLVTWSGVGESHDKWCSLLTPSLGYLWLINWSEKETCWRSRGRQRQASMAVPQSGPQALVEREGERVRKKQPSLSLSLLSVSCLLWREKETTHSSGLEWKWRRKPACTIPNCIFSILVCIQEPTEWNYLLFIVLNERRLS